MNPSIKRIRLGSSLSTAIQTVQNNVIHSLVSKLLLLLVEKSGAENLAQKLAWTVSVADTECAWDRENALVMAADLLRCRCARANCVAVNRAMRTLKCIVTAGIGSPTSQYNSSPRAAETADAILWLKMAQTVLYNADPMKDKTAVKFGRIDPP